MFGEKPVGWDSNVSSVGVAIGKKPDQQLARDAACRSHFAMEFQELADELSYQATEPPGDDQITCRNLPTLESFVRKVVDLALKCATR